MLTIGSQQINDLYVGSQQIREAYVGQTLIYPVIDYTEPFYVENPDTSSHDVVLGVSGADFNAYYSSTPLTANGNIPIDTNDFDGSVTFGDSTTSTVSISIPAQSKLYLYIPANQCGFYDYKLSDGSYNVNINGSDRALNIGGNIMSLLYGEYFTGTERSVGSTSTNTFYRLFKSSTMIDDASKLLLPITTAPQSCYREMFDSSSVRLAPRKIDATTMSDYSCWYMFWHCTSLTTAPELPATTLAVSCYRDMFNGCTSLVTAPSVLPATTLVESCYYTMFKTCTSLVTAPSIMATTLARDCCRMMFYECAALVNVPSALLATTLVDSCYKQMFQSCISLVVPPAISATSTAYGCCNKMFYNCTALKESPELLSTDLRDYSYEQMFYECNSLNKITCNAVNFGTNSLNLWTKNVSLTGSFYKNSSSSWSSGASGIPDNWTVYDI